MHTDEKKIVIELQNDATTRTERKREREIVRHEEQDSSPGRRVGPQHRTPSEMPSLVIGQGSNHLVMAAIGAFDRPRGQMRLLSWTPWADDAGLEHP